MKRDVAGFGQDELFDFNLDPWNGELLQGGVGEVGRESLDQFSLLGLGGSTQELAKVEVVEGMGEVVGLSCFLQIGNGHDSGAEELLRLGAFGGGHADMTKKLQIDNRDSGGHQDFGRRTRAKARKAISRRAKSPT